MVTKVRGSTSEGLTEFVGSVAELEALSLAVGTHVYLADGDRAGEGVIKSGSHASDPKKGRFIDLANGNYWERLEVTSLEPRFYGLTTQDQIQTEAAGDSQQYRHISYGRFELINGRDDTLGLFDAPNFAGQTNYGSEPIGFVFHHYTDGTMIEFDNVGESNDVLVLKNAQNATRRPDKASSFVGSGNYLKLAYHDDAAGFARTGFFIDKNMRFIWTGEKGIATLFQNKAADGVYAFQFETTNPHQFVWRIKNGANVLGSIQNDVSKTRMAIKSDPSQTSGMYVQAGAGNLLLDSASQIRALKPISSNTGDLILTADGDVVQNAKPAALPKYTDAASGPVLPGARRGSLAYNLATDRPMFWNGSAWVDL